MLQYFESVLVDYCHSPSPGVSSQQPRYFSWSEGMGGRYTGKQVSWKERIKLSRRVRQFIRHYFLPHFMYALNLTYTIA